MATGLRVSEAAERVADGRSRWGVCRFSRLSPVKVASFFLGRRQAIGCIGVVGILDHWVVICCVLTREGSLVAATFTRESDFAISVSCRAHNLHCATSCQRWRLHSRYLTKENGDAGSLWASLGEPLFAHTVSSYPYFYDETNLAAAFGVCIVFCRRTRALLHISCGS